MEGEFSAEFRKLAGLVLARRNRAVLASASVVKVPAQALRRVGQRQGLQLALMEKGPALRSFSEEGGAR